MAAQGELDPYALCPCGSGKKLKFCCQDIAADMLRVMRLVHDDQLKPALQQLDPLEKKPGLNPSSLAWILTTKAMLLVEDDRAKEAEPSLRKVLGTDPNNPSALALLALLRLRSAGRKEAWNLVNRVCSQDMSLMPPSLPGLLLEVGTSFLEDSQYLAAHHFLQLANFADQNSEETSELLLSVLSKADIPYPLRGNYTFRLNDLPEAIRSKVAEAEVHSQRGAVAKASATLQEILTAGNLQGAAAASLNFNLGLCQAWSGEIEGAIESFRNSAKVDPDFDQATDTEALAQILSHYHVEPQQERTRVEIPIGSPSRLLTLLDKEPTFTRQPMPPADPADPTQRPVALYSVADRPRVEDDATVTAENAPRIIGTLAVFDAAPDVPDSFAILAFQVTGKEPFESTLQSLRNLAGDELKQEGTPKVAGAHPAIFDKFLEDYLLPPKTSLRAQLGFAKGVWQKLIDETWMELPLAGLGGKSPKEAQSDPALRRQLAASVIVLETICESRGHVLDAQAVRGRLGLSEPMVLPVTDNTRLQQLNLFELRRLPVKQLSDVQLLTLIRLLSVWRINGIMYHALIERLARPGMDKELPKDKTCLFLAKFERSRLTPEESLAWLAKAREEATARKAPLHEQFAVDLQELVERGDVDRKDPQLPILANQIWTRYAVKVPQLRPTLVQLLTELELSGPWQLGDMAVAGAELAPAGAPGTGGWWGPGAIQSASPAAGSPGEAGSGGSKLWLPGQ